VIGVRCSALHSVHQELLKANGFLAKSHFSGIDRDIPVLCKPILQRRGGLPCCRSNKRFGFLACIASGFFVHGLGLSSQVDGICEKRVESVGIEIDVRDGREQCLDSEAIDIRIACTELSRAMCVGSDPIQRVKEQVLKCSRCRILAADTKLAGPVLRLFALIAVHGLPPGSLNHVMQRSRTQVGVCFIPQLFDEAAEHAVHLVADWLREQAPVSPERSLKCLIDIQQVDAVGRPCEQISSSGTALRVK